MSEATIKNHAAQACPQEDFLVEWAPDGFDPAAFALVAGNRRLRGR